MSVTGCGYNGIASGNRVPRINETTGPSNAWECKLEARDKKVVHMDIKRRIKEVRDPYTPSEFAEHMHRQRGHSTYKAWEAGYLGKHRRYNAKRKGKDSGDAE